MSRGAIILTLVAVAFLGLPSLRGLVEDAKKREIIENRKLASFPYAGIQSIFTGEFFSQLDLYLSDHFGYSQKLNRFHQSIVYFAFRDDPLPNFTLGRDGFVFLNSHSRDTPYAAFENLCLNDSGRGGADTVPHHWRDILFALNQREYRAILTIIPTKPVIFPEMLPLRVPEELRRACGRFGSTDNIFTRLRRDAGKRGLAVYYPFKEFSAARYNGNFYPKENFHWAGESIHLFMLGLFDTLGIAQTEAYITEPRTMETEAELSRFLGVRLTAKISDYEYPYFGVSVRDREPGFITRWYSRAVDFSEASTLNPITPRTALLISNSFGHFAVKHLAPAYRSIVQINVNNLLPEEGVRFFREVIPRVAPDDVIFMFHDGTAIGEGRRMHQYLFGDS